MFLLIPAPSGLTFSALSSLAVQRSHFCFRSSLLATHSSYLGEREGKGRGGEGRGGEGRGGEGRGGEGEREEP